MEVSSNTLSIGLETNGKGYHGYLVELPGAFLRGATENQALSKANREAHSYLKWLGVEGERKFGIRVVQRSTCSLMVEDADNEILLDGDKGEIGDGEFKKLADITTYSAKSFLSLYNQAEFKEWVDESRVRKTFYGENPSSIQKIFDHVKETQYYYLSRTRVPFERVKNDFLVIRELCLGRIEELFRSNNNLTIYELNNELWTLKKILRRFVWHDRIHGRAIGRILEKQKRLGMIDGYTDSFSQIATASE